MGLGVKAGVENGAILTTYLFRYTSECTIRSQIFNIYFASGGKGASTPLTKILRTPLQGAESAGYDCLVVCHR